MFKYFETSQTMCSYFIEYLSKLNQYTLLIGFNSSSQKQYNSEQYSINNIYGYDLAFIVHQSNIKTLTPINSIYKIDSTTWFFCTVKIKELKNVLIFDCLPFLNKMVNVAGLSKKMDNYSLNEFCWVFKTEQKNYISHWETQELLLSENPDKTKLWQFFEYGI